MTEQDRIFIGGGGEGYRESQSLLLKYANRHGLIAGATGTGKTVTLQILAEGFSAAGVPVFLSDVKGDLSGLAAAGSETFKLHEAFTKRAGQIGFDDYRYEAFPVTFEPAPAAIPDELFDRVALSATVPAAPTSIPRPPLSKAAFRSTAA